MISLRPSRILLLAFLISCCDASARYSKPTSSVTSTLILFQSKPAKPTTNPTISRGANTSQLVTVFMGKTLIFDYIVYSSARTIYVNTNPSLWSSIEQMLSGGRREFEGLFTTVLIILGATIIIIVPMFIII